MLYGAILILFILFLPNGLESLIPRSRIGSLAEAEAGQPSAGGRSSRRNKARVTQAAREAGRQRPSAFAYR